MPKPIVTKREFFIQLFEVDGLRRENAINFTSAHLDLPILCSLNDQLKESIVNVALGTGLILAFLRKSLFQ